MDRSTVRLIALREILERGRDKAFFISTAITVTVLVLLIVFNSIFDETPKFDVAAVGEDAVEIAELAERDEDAFGAEITVRKIDTEDEAIKLLEDGEVQGVLVGSERFITKDAPSRELEGAVAVAQSRFSSIEALRAAGLSDEEIRAALEPRPLAFDTLEAVDPERDQNRTLAFVGVFLLYGQILGYGVWIAMGVVEEKQSRVVELLLSTVRPTELLSGKVIGIGLLSFAQLVFMGVAALVTAVLTGNLELTGSQLATIGSVLLWFFLGFSFYSCLYAAAGARVSRQEEVQNSTGPLTAMMIASFFIALFTQESPEGTLATVSSFIPPIAPLVMPGRIAAGVVPGWQIAASVGLSIAATALLIPFAARIYRGAVLKTRGTVGWRAALRSDDLRASG